MRVGETRGEGDVRGRRNARETRQKQPRVTYQSRVSLMNVTQSIRTEDCVSPTIKGVLNMIASLTSQHLRPSNWVHIAEAA